MIGEEETRKRIRAWMVKELGPAWKVVSIARYEKCWIAIAANQHGEELREGLFTYDRNGALTWAQPIYRE